MDNDTNVRLSRKDAVRLKKIAKSRGWTVKGTIGVIITFYTSSTIIK